jgi:twinfilin-like protein
MHKSEFRRCYLLRATPFADFGAVLPAAVHEAFASFVADASALALPLTLANGTLQPSPTVRPTESSTSFQAMLNDLNAVIDPRTPLYLLLRRNVRLFAITFVPYLAKESDRTALLKHRQDLVQLLGDKHFSHSLVCKEIGEITDARSWTERDGNESPVKLTPIHVGGTNSCDDESCKTCAMKDVGYKRNRCRLCDRRMKNKIAPDALEALQLLKNPGAIVQIVSKSDHLRIVVALTFPVRRHYH